MNYLDTLDVQIGRLQKIASGPWSRDLVLFHIGGLRYTLEMAKMAVRDDAPECIFNNVP